MTPTQVWLDYNPKKDPLETAITASSESGNFIDHSMYFTADKTSSGSLRAFCHIVYDKRWTDDRAAVLVVPSLIDKIDYSTLSQRLISEGYVVCLIDYAGVFDNSENKTTFPKELGFASLENCQQYLYTINTSARETPWYVWGKIIRRAISVMEEHRLIDNNRIGIIGFGMGAQLAWQIAGIDGRIQALLAVNGGGFLWLKGKSRFLDSNVPSSEEISAFSTGVGAETYAKLISCPTCLIASTNSDIMDVDRAGDILATVPSNRKLLLIDKGTSSQITINTFESALRWLRYNFAVDGQAYPIPTLEFECLDNKLYLKLHTDKPSKAQSVFVCEGEEFSPFRYWVKLEEGQLVGDNSYGYVVPVENIDDLIVAYASVNYDDDIVASTPVTAAVPSKMGAEQTIFEGTGTPHIIYPSIAGLETFSASTHSVLLDSSVLHEIEGPHNIMGVTTDDGNLNVLRTSKEMSLLSDDAAFRFDVYSKEARDLRIRIKSKSDSTKYYASVQLKGGNFWQNILLQSTDFKSEQGKPLQKFSLASKCSFLDTKGLIYTNMIWI